MELHPAAHYDHPDVPLYVFLQRAEDYGAAAMLWSGEEGAKVQEKAFRDLGCKVKALVAVVGRYDVVVIADVPDDATALAVSLHASENGFYTEALRGFGPAELSEARDRLRSVIEERSKVKEQKRRTPRQKARSRRT